jgi:hypothetical protein
VLEDVAACCDDIAQRRVALGDVDAARIEEVEELLLQPPPRWSGWA